MGEKPKFREYEVMVPVNDTEEMEKQLESMGAIKVKKVLQIDNYYDFLPLKLSKKDELLRIREEYDQSSKEFLEGEFSWKSARRGIKEYYEVRDDISVKIKEKRNLDSLHKILNKLGIEIIVKLKKVRDRWTLKKDNYVVDFEFDKEIIAQGLKMPERNIGSFIQATIETSEDIKDEMVKKLLWKVLEKELNYKYEDFEPRSYIEIYLDLKKSKNL
ncbi:MAG: CYTH domain-containing protein [Candidatus Helarchaeota archaeon]